MHYIYCLTNKINNKKYVGRTNDIKRRMIQHKNDSFNKNCKRKYETPLAQAIRKYGWENFSIEILDKNENADIINELEKHYINKLNTYGKNGYNASIGGEFGYEGRVYTSKVENILDKLIKDLQDNALSINLIASKYNLSASYVSDINNGTRLHQKNLIYPLRKPPQSKLLSIYPKIIDDLKNSNLSMRKIAEKEFRP